MEDALLAGGNEDALHAGGNVEHTVQEDETFAHGADVQTRSPLKKVAVYLVIAYAWTFIFGWIFVAYQKEPALRHNIFAFLGVAAFGPTGSAFVTQYWLDGGVNGMKKLIRRCHPKLIPRAWVLGCVFLFPALLCTLSAFYVWFGGPPPETKQVGAFFTTMAMSIPVGSMGEEFGWRGMMLPDVQDLLDEFVWRRTAGSQLEDGAARQKAPQWRWSPIVASAIIGVFWGCWHLPSFFVDQLRQSHVHFAQFVLQSILYAVFFTWQSNCTSASILAAWIMHASINTTGGLNPWGDVEYPSFLAMPNSLWTLMLLMYCLALVWVVGPQLGRKPCDLLNP